MRAMGGGPGLLFRITLLEGLLMVLAGLLTGLALGHLACELLGAFSEAGRSIVLTGWYWADGQWLLTGGILLAGLLVAILPAWLASRINVANTLRRGY